MATERTDLSLLGAFIGPLFGGALGWLVYQLAVYVSTEIRMGMQEGSKGL